MNLQTEWVERFIQAGARVPFARRRPLTAGKVVYSMMPGAMPRGCDRVRHVA